jgi:histone H3/H4
MMRHLIQARIRKTIKLDPEVKNLSKEALLLISKSAEFFVEQMAQKSCNHALRRGVRTVKATDMKFCVHKNTELEFLRSDFPMDPLEFKAAEAAIRPITSQRVKSKVSSGKTSSIANYFSTKRKADDARAPTTPEGDDLNDVDHDEVGLMEAPPSEEDIELEYDKAPQQGGVDESELMEEDDQLEADENIEEIEDLDIDEHFN